MSSTEHFLIKIHKLKIQVVIQFHFFLFYHSMDNCGNANPSGITTRKRKSQNYYSHTMQTVTRRRRKTLMKSRQQCHNGKCRVIRRRIQGKLHPTRFLCSSKHFSNIIISLYENYDKLVT